RFHHVLALAVVGFWLGPRGDPRRRLRWYFVLATAGGLLYGAVIGRYRLPLVAVLLVEAAFGAGRIAAWWRAREWRRATLPTLAAVAIAVVSAAIPPGAGHARYRGAEFLVNANAYYERGDGDRAL